MLHRLCKINPSLKLGVWLLAMLAFACGDASNDLEKNEIIYNLARRFTGEGKNSLQIRIADSTGFQFKISGSNFVADVVLDEFHDIQDTVLLTFDEEGNYSMGLEIRRPDGVSLVDETVKWTYSSKKANTPSVSFSERATSDDAIIAEFAANLSADVSEVWIAGDLAVKPQGSWYPMPSDLRIPLQVTPSDGMKNFTMRYRNVYGNEGDEIEASILKKSIGPTNCVAQETGATTSNVNFLMYFAGQNDGPLFYQVSGDVTESFEVEFVDAVNAVIKLTPEEGEKTLQVKVYDLAENLCIDQEFKVTLDKSYAGYGLAMDEDILWSDSLDVTVVNRFDHTDGVEVEMYLSGNIQPAANTFAWVPFSKKAAVQLTPVDGNRFIYAQYRTSLGVESKKIFTSVYLKPFVQISGSGPTYQVTVSHLSSLVDVTLVGCSQTYSHVAYASSYSCTPTQAQVQATFRLNDGSEFSRSASF